jgi:hypothetical protein
MVKAEKTNNGSEVEIAKAISHVRMPKRPSNNLRIITFVFLGH